MIARCLFEHLNRRGASVIRWVALAACLGGCAAPASRGENPGPAIDWTRNPPSISQVEDVATPDSGPTKAEAEDVAALPEVSEPTDSALPEASLPVIELTALAPLPPEDQPEPESEPIPLAGAVPGAEAKANAEAALVDESLFTAGAESPLMDESLQTAACTSCGQFHSGGQGGTFGGSCGPGGCIPGRSKPCYHAEHSSFIGRFATNLYHCLCCPDPCYEPAWVPEANASFFVDPARPRTQKRLRWDHGQTLWFPDRSEYFWARSFRGPGPQPRRPVTKNGKPIYGERTINYDQLYVYMEAALKGFSFFTEVPYRSTSPDLTAHHAGFADMNIGTKSLLLDCDLMQLTLQFRTFLPIGSVSDGLGNGHVSLEPSLLMAVHLAPHTYFQGQLAEWIPLGGDPDYAGAILHYHFSLNHVLYRLMPDVPLIGTLEFNGWSFQDGAFTAPVLGPQNSSGDSYLSLGPGLRVSVCDYVDFGVGTAFALNSPNWSDALIRSEIRIFY